jgi:phosphohistidine phosphatase SixA
LRDFERTLAERGLLDIEKMAERFSQGGRSVQCIISSPAVRAKTTAMQFARDIGFEEEEVAANPELYFAGTAMFLKAARLIDDVYDSAMLVGHNPAITEFVNQMCHADIENIPTEAKAFLGEMSHIFNAIFGALQHRESAYASVLGALLELAGEQAQAVKPPVEEPLDESWAEPVVFDGCSSKGQAKPGQAQPVHIVRRSAPGSTSTSSAPRGGMSQVAPTSPGASS